MKDRCEGLLVRRVGVSVPLRGFKEMKEKKKWKTFCLGYLFQSPYGD